MKMVQMLYATWSGGDIKRSDLCSVVLSECGDHGFREKSTIFLKVYGCVPLYHHSPIPFIMAHGEERRNPTRPYQNFHSPEGTPQDQTRTSTVLEYGQLTPYS